MTQETQKKRSLRVRRMNTELKKIFPKTKIHLNYGNTWELLVAVVLSAQCTDIRVNEVTKELFKKYRTVKEYADASQVDMEKAVFCTGFYHAKAKHIRDAARMIQTTFGGKVPGTMDLLIQIPGVGRKTANVILSNAFGVDAGIAVDTHVRRFALRFDLTDHTDPKGIEQDLMKIMPKSEWWSFNHRLIEYGRKYCPARKHDCATHPLTYIYPKAAESWPKAKAKRNLNK